MNIKYIKVLGTPWQIITQTEKENEKLEDCDGYCDYSVHKIVIREFEPDKNNLENLNVYIRKVTRHEIVHAFLHESGLGENAHTPYTSWAKNEEMVDWIAFQGPKIHEVWAYAGVLEVMK